MNELLRQSANWRLISLCLARPTEETRTEVNALRGEVEPALSKEVAAVTDLTEGEYLAGFGPGGTVSPREVRYCGFEDPGRVLSELNVYYEAFAFHPKREDPADHAAVEAGFLSYLYLKEAYARAKGNEEAVEIVRDARVLFIKNHLARILRGMSEASRGMRFRSLLNYVVSLPEIQAAPGQRSTLPTVDPLESEFDQELMEESL